MSEDGSQKSEDMIVIQFKTENIQRKLKNSRFCEASSEMNDANIESKQ